MAGIDEGANIQSWTSILETHEQRLQEQIRYLLEESDYYRRKFDEWEIDPEEVRALEDLARVPFTTKDDERRCQHETEPDQPLGEHQAAPTGDLSITLSSSGTTGKPTYFGLTTDDREHWETLVARAAETMGVRSGDTVVHAIGRPIVPGGLPYINGFAKLGANVVPAGGGSSEQLLATLQDVSPDVLHSTPSHLEYLVDRAPEILGHGLDELGIRILIGGGEPGLGNPEVRERIRNGWGVNEIRDVIGIGDVSGAIAAECSHEHGAHYIAHGHIHPELIDPDTGERRSFEAGSDGELVYTPLTREATPLLRFRSGDYARVLGTDCPCGLKTPRVRIIGRADDMLIYKAKNVYPEALREVIVEVEGVTPQMKVVLPHDDKVQFTSPIPMRITRDESVARTDEAIVDELTSAVRNRLSVRVDPTLVSPGEIEPSQYKTDLIEIDEGGG
ncbi:phenylacetate--CoA ligase family protein [Natrarchaeobius halalkaliphilus]|uniref:Phenylacetate--CoA ligase family protein n=1 Tax=Natrarchaeobius halalkaliphilus TaxID=1679091 RepID=A0A3N6NUF6_9EURY|nr:AMP-binding protein [Natrarchaeobius halalkaliphilus]RQG86790.1 phenylacetate--CoA ligase family protein [Natrarchaeobius halalkaliphilus]